jgi:uncharacterized protein YukJ
MIEKYFFSDFLLSNYKRLLGEAKQLHKFIFFDQETVGSNNIILRHDLEFSIPIALRMAQMEAELGIRSTYFVQLHSEFFIRLIYIYIYDNYSKKHFNKH